MNDRDPELDHPPDPQRVMGERIVESEHPIRRMVRNAVSARYPRFSVNQTCQRADELFSEVVVRAMAGAHRFDPKRALLPWLRTIARRILYTDQARPVGSSPSLDEMVTESKALFASDPHAETFSEIASRTVRSLLAELSERDRTLVQLRSFEGLSHAAIAERLGISTGAAQVAHTRAMARLKTLASVRETCS